MSQTMCVCSCVLCVCATSQPTHSADDFTPLVSAERVDNVHARHVLRVDEGRVGVHRRGHRRAAVQPQRHAFRDCEISQIATYVGAYEYACTSCHDQDYLLAHTQTKTTPAYTRQYHRECFCCIVSPVGERVCVQPLDTNTAPLCLHHHHPHHNNQNPASHFSLSQIVGTSKLEP